MNHSARLLVGSWGLPPKGKFRISGLLKPSLMRFLSNMAETCCEIAANYIVDSRRDIRSHVYIAISAETHSLHASAVVTTVVCAAPCTMRAEHARSWLSVCDMLQLMARLGLIKFSVPRKVVW